MIRALRAATYAAAALTLGGCVSLQQGPALSPAQCAAVDWRAVGREDGAAGRPAAALTRRQADCPSLDAAAWRAGRDEGLAGYCTAENAYALGRAGREYEGVCPAPLAEAFLREYERGLSFWRGPGYGYGYGGWGWRGPRVGISSGPLWWWW